jgi:integrase
MPPRSTSKSTSTDPRLKSRRSRGRRHPGVTLLKPDPERRIGWRARYVDPDTGRMMKESLEPILSTEEARTEWAIRKSRALAKRRLELENGAARATGTPLEDAIGKYWQAHPALRAKTLAAYRTPVNKLLVWARKTRLASVDDVTRARLLDLRTELVNEPRHAAAAGGKRGARRATNERRSAHSINRELRALRTVLGDLCDRDLFPRLTHDDLRRALKREDAAIERVDYRKPAELRKLIEAALRHDADTYAATREEHAGERPLGTTLRYAPVAPIITSALLSGMRAGELIDLTWQHVDLDALDNEGRTVGEVYITAASKTKRARTVGLEVSPALRKLLAALHVKTGGKGSVFGVTRGELKAAEKRLRNEFGAPARTNMQALRRTCGTVLTNAGGIFGAASAYRSAKQLGHSVTIAEKHYVDVARGIPRDARTLEAAMQIESHVQQVIDSVSAPRVEKVRKIG